VSAVLPIGFDDLEPFAQPWVSFEDMQARYRHRQDIAFEDLQTFYSTVAPRLGEILAHLDTFGAGPLPPAEERLFRLVLGLVEAAEAVEFFGRSRLPRAPYPHVVPVGRVGVDA
jgi:hypothetical protein